MLVTAVARMVAAIAFAALGLGGLYLHIEYSGWLLFAAVVVIL
jgi:hypothetical protein